MVDAAPLAEHGTGEDRLCRGVTHPPERLYNIRGAEWADRFEEEAQS